MHNYPTKGLSRKGRQVSIIVNGCEVSEEEALLIHDREVALKTLAELQERAERARAKVNSGCTLINQSVIAEFIEDLSRSTS